MIQSATNSQIIVFFLFSELVKGDSGLIVYLVSTSGALIPYGMFVGELDLGEESEDFGPIYQAIVLHQALRNIEIDYPHHVENIQSYMILTDLLQ